ncbi:MAG: hypothetical protein PHP01_08430, partial [Phycisphaerae bacterium]|nr:hypothetical protein [Phycisphaerae bacterium]
VTSPNGGETWIAGQTYTVTWNSTNPLLPGSSYPMWRALLYKDDVQYSILSSSSNANDHFGWTIPAGLSGSKFKIKIEYYTNSALTETVYDISDNYFTIAAPTVQHSITVASPNGGETLQMGQTYRIRWNSTGVDNVMITLSNPGLTPCFGSGCNMSVTDMPVSASLGYYDWVVPFAGGLPRNDSGAINSTNTYRINIAEVWTTANPSPGSYSFTYGVKDSSDNYFSIAEGTTTCTDSDGGKNYYVKGTTTDSKTGSFTDYCLENGSVLYEAFCPTPTSIRNYEFYTCPNGCENGACKQVSAKGVNFTFVSAVVNTSVTSNDLLASGTITFRVQPYGGTLSQFTDTSGSFAVVINAYDTNGNIINSGTKIVSQTPARNLSDGETGVVSVMQQVSKSASGYSGNLRFKIDKIYWQVGDAAGEFSDTSSWYTNYVSLSGAVGLTNINQLANIEAIINQIAQQVKALTGR